MQLFRRTKAGRTRIVSSLLMILLLGVTHKTQAQQKDSLLKKIITIDLEAGPLANALQKIEKAADIPLGYNENIVKGINISNLVFTSKTIRQILTVTLNKTGLEFNELNGHIIINPSRTANTPASTLAAITGHVTDVAGNPLAGASIAIGSKGFTSDSAGYFHLNLPPGNYTALYSAIGFQPVEKTIKLTAGEQLNIQIPLVRSENTLNTVVVNADRVITSTDKNLINTVRVSAGVVSGISSQQITIGVDRSASEVARRVSGISLRDGFISIRGMSPRYNPVYLNNTYLPSADPEKRAFNFDLLPSTVIDQILVYKSPAPELPADFAGGVVKVRTKNSLPVKRLEISVNAQYRTGNKFFSNHASSVNGKYDWLGIDDGTRALPKNLPLNEHGELAIPDIIDANNAYSPANEAIAKSFIKRAVKSWSIQQVYHPADIQLDLTNYTYFNIGKLKLNSATVGRYELQRSYFRSEGASNANKYNTDLAPDGSLMPYYNDKYRLYYDSVYSENVRLSALQQFSMNIGKNNEVHLMGIINRNTKDVLQMHMLKEWNIAAGNDLEPLRIESAYSQQQVALAALGGSHSSRNKRHELEWNASYSKASSYDPNQFSTVYNPDPKSIQLNSSFGYIIKTDSTTWNLNTVTRKNTTIGRFVDGEGSETRRQGNLDYIIKPFDRWNDFHLKAGAYIEDRKKTYRFSGLVLQDFPEMPFSANPWDSVGAILEQLNQGDTKMHVGRQAVGLGGSETNGYDAIFQNIAGYVAVNLPFHFTAPFSNKRKWYLKLYGGTRIEYSHREVKTSDGEVIRYDIVPVNGQNVIIGEAANPYQHFWLPSMSAILQLNEQWQVRLAYGKTLNRPEMRELSPFVTFKPNEGFTYIGKPTLHDARIDNYDLRVEWYPDAGEMISIGGYHKNLKEPIEEINRDLNTGVSGYGPNNLPFAKIWGAELELRKTFRFLPGKFFRYTGIIINTSYNYTKTSNVVPPTDGSNTITYYPGGQTRPFQGAAPWIVNAGLFYDNAQGGTRISLQYNATADRMLYNTGSTIDQDPWAFEKTRHLLDISILQKITPWVSIRVAAQNLLDAPIKWYVDGDFNKHFNTEPSLVTFNTIAAGGGIATHQFRQGDYYIRNYKPGIYYTLGFVFNMNFKSSKAKN